MSSDQVSYAYCVHSIKYIIKMIGYDALIKEAKFIHHLEQNSSLHNTPINHSIVPLTNNIIDVSETKQNEIVELTTTKPITIVDTTTNKYVRSPIPDELRCEALISNGSRCTLKKDNLTHTDNKYCSRHTPK